MGWLESRCKSQCAQSGYEVLRPDMTEELDKQVFVYGTSPTTCKRTKMNTFEIF